MKNLIESLAKENMFFKEINKIDLKKLKIRTKLSAYKAISIDSEYCSIFEIDKKSRFIKKDSIKLLEINELLKDHYEHNFAKSFLSISSSLCSKAKELLENEQWIVIK